MSSLATFECTPRQTKKNIIRCMEAGVTPFIQSSPGMGKSAMIKAIAKQFRLKVIDFRLSTRAPTDLSGLPGFNNGIASFMPFDTFPLEGTPIPKGYEGWLLFLDEFNSAPKTVQAAAYQLVLDRMVGINPLHERVVVVAAGNLATDQAITNNLGSAMRSRVAQLYMKLNLNEFMMDVAFPNNWDDRIIAYLNMYPDRIHDFQKEGKQGGDDVFCCPRTWEFVNNFINGREYNIREDGTYEMEDEAPLLSSVITSGVALEFITFTKVFQRLPKPAEIAEIPDILDLPATAEIRFATVTSLITHVTKENFAAFATYTGRMPEEFALLFLRGVMIRHPTFRALPDFAKAAIRFGKKLHD